MAIKAGVKRVEPEKPRQDQKGTLIVKNLAKSRETDELYTINVDFFMQNGSRIITYKIGGQQAIATILDDFIRVGQLNADRVNYYR
jgi:hypothetical protein